MSASMRQVAFMTFAVVMSAGPHAARAAQDAGGRDPCAASRQVMMNPPAGSDAGPQSVDALELIRALSKQNDELKNENAKLAELARKVTGDRAKETKELQEKLDDLEQGRDGGAENRGRPPWQAVALLVVLAFAIGMTVARRKDGERDT